MLLVWLKEKRRRDSHVDVNIRETHHGAEIWSCFIIWTGSPQLTHSTADWVLEQSFSLCGGFWYHIFGSGTKLYVTAVFLSVWRSDGRTYGHPLFGSGTKLYVTVNGNPAVAGRSHLSQRRPCE
ncbi:hypothetical protein ATANTOWER_026235 [Ataeniobius toweri]|uniref:Uncharacterized protein n=1 Tax=Ataeniobius toweri TaxID=208326 RepID=A0ABU7AH25_9TELE|nr:hypothetical protein [Ataeniobius toweri]